MIYQIYNDFPYKNNKERLQISSNYFVIALLFRFQAEIIIFLVDNFHFIADFPYP